MIEPQGALPGCKHTTVPCGFASCEIHGDKPKGPYAPFGTDEWLEQAREELKHKACYGCGEIGAMSLDWEFWPTDNFSLAGAQTKVSVRRVLVMSHEGCGLRGWITVDTD